MSGSSSTSVPTQPDGGQQQQPLPTNVNAAAAIIGALPTTGQPVTGQQAVNVTAANRQEIADLRLENQRQQHELHQQNLRMQQQELLMQQLQLQLQQLQQQQVATAPVQHVSHVKEHKPPEPREYRGTRDRTPIRDWLRHTEKVLKLGHMPPSEHVEFASAFLRDDAEKWYQLNESSIHSWNDFRRELIQRFRDPREVDKAQERLMALKQIGSVEQYTNEFTRASAELADVTTDTPSNRELVLFYKRGLKSYVRQLLANQRAVTDLKELQAMALEIDAEYYNSNRSDNTSRLSTHNDYASNDVRFHSRSNYREHFSRPRNDERRADPRADNSSTVSTSSGPAPMDTSHSIYERNQPRPYHPNNRRDDRATNSNECYHCGKSGHYARECPQKQPQRRALLRANTITEENTDTERVSLIMQESSDAHEDVVL
jgi:hypothetical protein